MRFFAKICLDALWFNKLRSLLTGVGVLVGVASVALITALSSSFLNHIQGTQSDRCEIGLVSSAETNLDVVEAIASPDIQSKLLAVAQREDVISFTPVRPERAVVVGLANGPDLGSLVVEFNDSVSVVEGRSFRQATGNVAIMFRNPEFNTVTVGSIIILDGAQFEVIGMTDSLGANGDSRIFLPTRVESQVIVEERNVAATYTLVARSAAQLIELTRSVLAQLNESIDPNLKFIDFSTELNSALQETFRTVQLLLGLIASISLAVAALNIVNVMYVATLERADEIAILRSIGLTRRGVQLLFLFESVIIVGAFAAIGCLVGNFIALVILTFLGMGLIFSWTNVTILLLVTFIVGVGGGLYPAHKAASIDPVRLLK